MRATGPTFWLLDGAFWSRGEHSLVRENVSVTRRGLVLAEDPSSALSLNSRDGSLGKLTLPLGAALDERGDIYLVPSGQVLIKRFERDVKEFEPLRTIGGSGTGARQFASISNIAIARGTLYVADRGNQRIQAFSLPRLTLRNIWRDLDAADIVAAKVAHKLAVFVLDCAKGRVLRHRPGTDVQTIILDSPANAGRWSRLLVDSEGLVYLFDEKTLTLSVYSASGEWQRDVHSAGDVRDCFPRPPLEVNGIGLLQVSNGNLFDRSGRRITIDPAEASGAKQYVKEGVWIGSALDSEIYRCQWHRVELQADIPPGCKLVVSTLTDSSGERRPGESDPDWRTNFELVGPAQGAESSARKPEFLIESQHGQCLWLRIDLFGDGYATPAVRTVRIHYPRSSYLKYLPAVYQANEESRDFLEAFLSVFQTEWEALEQRTGEMERYFDPKAVPAGPFLDWLAGWLALPLEESWTYEQKRKLLAAAPEIYPRLGTLEGIRRYVRVYLQILAGNDQRQISDAFPLIVEGFRERRRLVALSKSTLGREGYGASMWSAGTVGRLQLGECSREGEARLVSVGDPDRDFFRAYAHRFQIFVPARFVKTTEQEQMIRRAIGEVKPAHTAYDLYVVGARFRVGVQSSVGLDSIIGDYPIARLAPSRLDNGDLSQDSEPRTNNLPPSSRLGYDTVLADSFADDAGFRLTRSGAQVGVATTLG